MSIKIDVENTFIGYIMQSGVSETKANKFPQFVCKLQAVQAYDPESQAFVDYTNVPECEATGYFVLFDKDAKATLNAKQIKKALPDWNGSIKSLNEDDFSAVPVQFRTEENEYKGKKSIQVSWIDNVDAVPGGTVGKMDDAGVSAIEAKYANAIRELNGGDKPAAIPTAKKVAAKRTAAPVVPKVSKPTSENLASAKELAKAAVEEQKERAAAAEWAALSPAEKKAATAKKAAETKVTKRTPPAVPKINKPTTPPVAEESPVEEGSAEQMVEALDLPATCTKDQAWEACETNAHPDKVETLAEVWTEVVKDLGYEVAVDQNNDWPEVRTRVLQRVIDGIPF